MAIKKGREVLLQIEMTDGQEDFANLGGIKSKTFKFTNADHEVTNDDSSGVQELLEGAGPRAMEVTGEGVVTGTAAFKKARDAARLGQFVRMRVIDPTESIAEQFTALFNVSECQQTGESNAGVTFSISMKSSGVVTAEAYEGEE